MCGVRALLLRAGQRGWRKSPAGGSGDRATNCGVAAQGSESDEKRCQRHHLTPSFDPAPSHVAGVNRLRPILTLGRPWAQLWATPSPDFEPAVTPQSTRPLERALPICIIVPGRMQLKHLTRHGSSQTCFGCATSLLEPPHRTVTPISTETAQQWPKAPQVRR